MTPVSVPVSCIIPTYNRGAMVCGAIEDLLRQEPLPLEIIVADQTEEHPQAIQDRLDRLAKHPLVRYFRLPLANVSKARNLGIREARGDVLLFTDDDIRVEPDFLAAHWRNYREDPTLDAVAGQVLRPGARPRICIPGRFYWRYIGWSFFPMDYPYRCRTMNLPSGNFSIRRELALEAGGFDEHYVETCGEDGEFSWRVHKAGGKAFYDPAATLIHLLSPMGGKRAGSSNSSLLCSRTRWRLLFYFWLRHFGVRAWRDMWRYLRVGLVRKGVLARPWLLVPGTIDLCLGILGAMRLIRTGPALPLLRKREETLRASGP